MYRKEYTKELGWKTFYYDKKEQYYGDFDMACEKFKYRDKNTLYPIKMLIFFNQHDYSNQGYFKIVDDWGVYSHIKWNLISRNY